MIDRIPAPQGDYVGGQWRRPSPPDGEIENLQPGDLTAPAVPYPWSLASVNGAVSAARGAWRAWDALGVPARANHLRAFQAVLRAGGDELAQIIALEAGKPLWEAKTEIAATLNKFEITLKEGAARLATDVIEAARGRVFRRPYGVMAVLGPFNFPVHLSNGHIVPALLAGNTVVLKPSEQTPASAQFYVACADKAGLPPGVLNLAHGAAAAGRLLTTHPEIDGVLFTGSYATGSAIIRAQEGDTRRILVLEMGGKNPAIVLDDADIAFAASEIAFSAFVTAGQRCTATSRVIATARAYGPLRERLAAIARGLRIGHPLEEGVFMGPMISRGAYDRFLQLCDSGAAAGAKAVTGTDPADTSRPGFYVRPAIYEVGLDQLDTAFGAEELFAPCIALVSAGDLDEAIALANRTEYGLAASVFTADPERFKDILPLLRAGIINHNRGTVGASSAMPFGGIGHSGNHRPAGVSSLDYCTYPVSCITGDPQAFAPPPGWPGE